MANKTLTSYEKLFFKFTFEEQLKTPLFVFISLSLSLSLYYLLTHQKRKKQKFNYIKR